MSEEEELFAEQAKAVKRGQKLIMLQSESEQRIATLEAALRDADATLDDSEHNLLLDCADGHQNRYRDNAVATLRTARRLIRAALAAQPAPTQTWACGREKPHPEDECCRECFSTQPAQGSEGQR